MSKFLFLVLFLFSLNVFSGEKEEVLRISQKQEFRAMFGEDIVVEYVNSDRTRVDILTNEYAFEADWAYKWAEAIGQSIFYAAFNDKKPGIILLVRDVEKEQRYIDRCKKAIERIIFLNNCEVGNDKKVHEILLLIEEAAE
jgi:hypothetical protein